ncbi:MAG: hypothetical protein HZC01_04045 [Candidatus Kerfeldbacteria bacterium]|nr:hypothetical protein [Candidatus Kerfeldbacteria bacterium]
MDKTRPPHWTPPAGHKSEIEGTSAMAQNAQSATEKPKKHHGWLIFFVVVFLLIIGIATAVAATGVYAVPVLTGVFKSDQPIDLGISNDPAYLETLYAKVPMTISSTRTNSLVNMFEGQIDVHMRGTSEEITAWLTRFEGDNPAFSNVQVNMIEGGMEVSGIVNEYIHAPAYIKAGVTMSTNKSIDLTVAAAKIGRVSVPQHYLDDVEKYFEDHINAQMARTEGFSMEKLEYHSGYSDFVGTLPARAFSHDRGWSALLID